MARKSRYGYYDRAGEFIPKGVWDEYQADEAYKTVGQYDNGSVRLKLIWDGRILDPDNTFRDCWPLFRLYVRNYNSSGEAIPDPIENDQTFSDEQAALKAYQKFLARWTESSFDEDTGTFVEADNTLEPPKPPEPPPPPDPDAPTSSVEGLKGMEDDGVGAW